MEFFGKPFFIGVEGWEDELRAATSKLDANFWSRFARVPPEEVDALENCLQRKLPEDFRCFLRTFGAGNFPDEFGGGIFSPAEIVEGCAGPILMLLGSGPWATDEEQRKFYVSRGQINPNPGRFLNGITLYHGINLLDLVQVGYDGMGCYYQLFCQGPERGLGFCRITPEGTIVDRCQSFSEGLAKILAKFHEDRVS